jgi:molybdopterin-guanine dinucleotide biosynthesis protein A
MMIDKNDVTAVILAGGLARRMGNADKGLVTVDGRPLVAQVLARLSPQVDRLMINANRNADVYARYGYSVVADVVPDFCGPLAGLHAALSATTTPWVLMVPCDAPRLPPDLAARFMATLTAHEDAAATYAVTAERAHPTFALVHRRLKDDIAAYLARGERKLFAFFRQCGAVETVFEDEGMFVNVNAVE